MPLLCPIASKFSLQKFANSLRLPFRELLPESSINQALEAEAELPALDATLLKHFEILEDADVELSKDHQVSEIPENA